MLRALILSGVLSLAFAAPALAAGTRDAAACKAMQATLAPRQTEIADLTAARDAAAELTEVSGEAWEDVEIHRLASKAHAVSSPNSRANGSLHSITRRSASAITMPAGMQRSSALALAWACRRR